MISTYFHEGKHFYKAFIVPIGESFPELAKIPNFKEYRPRSNKENIYLFGITREEYMQGRQTQREEIESKLKKKGLDEDLVISDNLTDEEIDKLLASKDDNDN